MNVQFSLCRLDLEIAYEDFFLDPMILRSREANIQWMIRSSLSQRVDTSQAFFRRLPSEVVDIVYNLKTNQQIHDALFYTIEETDSGFLDLYNIFDYYCSQNKHSDEIFPDDSSVRECFYKWEKDNFSYPCLIDGVFQWTDFEDKLIYFFDDDTSLTPFIPKHNFKYFYALAKRVAVTYNDLVMQLFKKDYLFYPAYLEYEHVGRFGSSFSRPTIQTYL